MNSRVRSRGGNGLPSTAMTSLRGDVERRRIDDAAVDGDAALRDPFLGIAARGKAGAGHHLGDALAGFLDAWRLRRALVEFRLALAIGAAAAERRTLCENLAVVLVLATRPIVTRFAARMLLPVGAAFAASARTVDRVGRSSAGDPRANAKSADAPRRRGRRAAGQSAACRNCAHRRGRDGQSRSPRSSRFCHGLSTDRHRGRRTKILARATIGRTARELLVTAKFSLRPIATGAIAITRRPGAKRPIATRTVAVLAKAFATRRIGPLLAATFARGIGLPVAKLPVGRTPAGRRTSSRGRSSRLKFGRSPRGLNGRFSPPPRSSRGLNERFSPSSPRDGRLANGLSPRGRGASPNSRRGGRSSPSRLPA